MGRNKKDQFADPLNRQMADLYATGMTLAEIGAIFGVTRERVRQRVKSIGVTRSEGGSSLTSSIRKEESTVVLNQRREARCKKAFGCSFSALELIAGPDPVITKNVILRAYRFHKNNSCRRAVEFSMTLPEWWAVWQASGKWEKRGRNSGEYVMARNRDEGGYSVGNVRICTCNENIIESYDFKPANTRKHGNHSALLGTGRGWTFCKDASMRPYQVMVGKKVIGYFQTEQEARSAYLEGVAKRRAELEEVV